jgi:hypothetical protein
MKGGAAAALSESALERIVVTDTVPPFRLGDGPVKDKLKFSAAFHCSTKRSTVSMPGFSHGLVGVVI